MAVAAWVGWRAEIETTAGADLRLVGGSQSATRVRCPTTPLMPRHQTSGRVARAGVPSCCRSAPAFVVVLRAVLSCRRGVRTTDTTGFVTICGVRFHPAKSTRPHRKVPGFHRLQLIASAPANLSGICGRVGWLKWPRPTGLLRTHARRGAPSVDLEMTTPTRDVTCGGFSEAGAVAKGMSARRPNERRHHCGQQQPGNDQHPAQRLQQREAGNDKNQDDEQEGDHGLRSLRRLSRGRGGGGENSRSLAQQPEPLQLGDGLIHRPLTYGASSNPEQCCKPGLIDVECAEHLAFCVHAALCSLLTTCVKHPTHAFA